MNARFTSVAPALLLAGCAGSGSAVLGVPRAQTPNAHQVAVSIVVTIPRATSASGRRPAYVSPFTQSAVVDVSGSGAQTSHTVIPCGTSTCTGTVPATIGTDTFAIALTDHADGTGAILSSGSTTTTVLEGVANSVNVTFDGVIASLRVTFDKPNPTVNTTTTVKVLVSAVDADGSTIVGPGAYDHPITVNDDDTSGATTMTPATLSSPSDPAPTLTYNGTWIGGDAASAPVTASVPANSLVKSATGLLVPVPQIVEYPIPTAGATPVYLVKGPDGAIWFTEQYGRKIGRVTTAGTFTEYPVPGTTSPYSNPQPFAITVGTDGNVWFSDAGTLDEAIESITPAGVITRYSIAEPNQFNGVLSMVWGSDGNIWGLQTQRNRVIRFAPSSGVVTPYAVPHASSDLQYITEGPDGAAWFTESNDGLGGPGYIGKAATNGTITEYAVSTTSGTSWPLAITTGPDGALWFTDEWNSTFGRVTTAGTLSEFARMQGVAIGGSVIIGPDGALWSSGGGGAFGRVSSKGTMTRLPVAVWQTTGGEPDQVTLGADGNVWFIDRTNNAIGKALL